MNAATRFTVIGAGHGGKAMAAHLALMGFTTTLYNRTYTHIEAIHKRGGIELESGEGAPCGFGKLSLVTSDMAEALDQAEVIMVVVPSSAHADIARTAAPHLQRWADRGAAPGAYLRRVGIPQSAAGRGLHGGCDCGRGGNFYLCQPVGGPAQARIFRIKEAVPLAALPATRTEQVLDAINPAYPQFIDGVNVLHTGLNNMGAIFHPALTLLNCGLDRSHARRLPVLHRRRYAIGGARAGGAGPRAGDGGFLAGHPGAHGDGMAGAGL